METLAGFLIALVVGLTGVGGGQLTVPILILGFHVPPAQAVGTALLFTTLVKVLAAPVYMVRREVDYRAAGLLLLGGLPGALLGVQVLNTFKTVGLQSAVLIVVGLTIVSLAGTSLYRRAKTRNRLTSEPERRKWLAAAGAPIGVQVGFSSSGAGGLGNLALLNCTANPPARVVGTGLLFGLLVSGAAGALHLASGNVDPALLFRICAGGIPGALGGAWFASYLPAKPFRTALTVFLIYLGSHLVWNGVQGFVR